VEFLIGFEPLSERLFVENAFGFLIGFGPLSESSVF